MGHLPAGTGLVGNEETIEVVDGFDKNVGIPSHDTSTNHHHHKAIRANFPSMWPFGGHQHNNNNKSFAVEGGGNGIRSSFADELQSSDDDEDEEREFGGDGQGEGEGEGEGKRRLSVTTEAKRRTSLEDDDEEDGELVEIQHAEMQGVEEGK